MRLRISMSLEWIAVASSMLILLVGVAYGFQYLFDGSAQVRYFRLFTLPFAALVLMLSWFVVKQGVWRVSEPEVTFRLGFLLMTISFLLTCYLNNGLLTPFPWWLPSFSVPVVAYLVSRKFGAKGSNLVFLFGLLLISSYFIARVPINAGGDMLEIIQFAAKDFLGGSSPYQPYLTVSGKEVPFGYWSGTWLPYVPLVALDVDMRLLNLLAVLGLVLLFEKAAGESELASLISPLTIYPFLLSPSVMKMILFGHLWLYWLAACAVALLIVRQRHFAAAFLLGFCLASRPTALFIAAPLAMYVFSRYGMKRTLSLGAVTAAVVLAFNLPFALIYGSVFWDNSYGILGGFGHKLIHFSLAGYFQDYGLSFLNKPLQIAIMLGAMAIVALRKNMTIQLVIMLAGLVYIWMILFNSYATRYVYFMGFLLVNLGLTLVLAKAYQNGDKNYKLATES